MNLALKGLLSGLEFFDLPIPIAHEKFMATFHVMKGGEVPTRETPTSTPHTPHPAVKTDRGPRPRSKGLVVAE